MERAILGSIAGAVSRRWLLAAMVLIGVLAADVAFTLQSPRSYLARTSLLIGPSVRVEKQQLVYSVDALGRSMVVGTYANVLAADIVRREALERVGVASDESASDIEIRTAAIAESALVQVTAVAGDPNLAADVANAIGQVGEARMSQFYPIYDLIVVTPATPPTRLYRPDFARNLSLGVVIGVLLGIACAWTWDAVARRASRRAG
jgi:succinoglycan biosynthesis transport protein ExoP